MIILGVLVGLFVTSTVVLAYLFWRKKKVVKRKDEIINSLRDSVEDLLLKQPENLEGWGDE